VTTDAPTLALEILVVEDHEPTQVALRQLLKRWGHHVYSAGTLKEAYQSLSEADYDVILLDIMLPDGEGYELLERADLMSAYVIVITALATEESKAKAAKYGCRDYLLKPEGVEQLSTCIENARREKAAL